MWIELVGERTKPYVFDTLYRKYIGENTQDELLVGTENRGSVRSIIFRYNDSQGNRRLDEYLFRDDKPGEFITQRGQKFLSHRDWPSNGLPIDTRYNFHFKELEYQVQSLKDSLEKCVALLKQSTLRPKIYQGDMGPIDFD